MTIETYTYLNSDTLNNKVDVDALHEQITISNIETALHGLVKNTTDFYICFKSILSTGDETLLDGIVANHNGEPSSTSLIQEVKIVEEGLNTDERTQGFYFCDNYAVTITPGVGAETVFSFSYPYQITVMSMKIAPIEEWFGDFITVNVSENFTIGVITSDATASQDVFDVSPTAIERVKRGYSVRLTDGTNTDELGRVTNMDSVNGQMSTEFQTTNSFLAATPTYIQFTAPAISNYRINNHSPVVFGDTKIGGTYVPANILSTLRYINTDGAPKTFYFSLNMLY